MFSIALQQKFKLKIMKKSIQKRMREEYKRKASLDLSKKYAYKFLDEVFDRNVFPSEKALKNLKVFDENMPDKTTKSEKIIRLLHEYGSPAAGAQLGGRYFGFVNGGVIPASLAAKWLADVWDQNTAMYVISPIASRLETVVQNWLVELFGLPKSTVAGFVSGTSSATFCGLAAARFRICERLGWDWNEKGMYGAPEIRIVTSRHAHSTVVKAIGLCGFGKERVEWVDVDDQGRIRADLMPKLDEKTIVILQAGNVNSGSFDDFKAICKKANEAKAWVHIDGAFGLWTAACEELSYLTKGIELADSWSVDGHKTLNTPYDCGIVLCKDEDALVSSLHMSGSYIVRSEERDPMMYTPEMSRRARIIELWAAMKYLGKSGIDEMILGMHKRATQFAKQLEEEGFQVKNDVVFNQVLVSAGSDEETLSTLKLLQKDRVCWCGGSEWFGKKVIRISVCNWVTTKKDVKKSVASFVKSRRKAMKQIGQKHFLSLTE
jgi:glutamate/tyrosine decarboxylase-like PLP-dependent enzyme